MTSNCDARSSAHQIKMTTICHWMTPPMKMFCVRHWPHMSSLVVFVLATILRSLKILGSAFSSHWIRACSGLLGSFDWQQLVNLIDHIWSSEGTDSGEGRSSLNSSTRLSTWCRQSWVFLITDETRHKLNVAFLAFSLNLLANSINSWSRSRHTIRPVSTGTIPA